MDRKGSRSHWMIFRAEERVSWPDWWVERLTRKGLRERRRGLKLWLFLGVHMRRRACVRLFGNGCQSTLRRERLNLWPFRLWTGWMQIESMRFWIDTSMGCLFKRSMSILDVDRWWSLCCSSALNLRDLLMDVCSGEAPWDEHRSLLSPIRELAIKAMQVMRKEGAGQRKYARRGRE